MRKYVIPSLLDITQCIAHVNCAADFFDKRVSLCATCEKLRGHCTEWKLHFAFYLRQQVYMWLFFKMHISHQGLSQSSVNELNSILSQYYVIE